MKKIVLKILLGFLLFSCSDLQQNKEEVFLADQAVTNNYQESDILKMIDSYQEIYLIQRDDKCGEWGGDKEQIRVYKNDPTGKLLLDYKKSIINCDDPYSQEVPAELIEKDGIESNGEILKLIEQSITDLTNHKLSSEQQISHSGIANYVISRDSTLLITDYPSYRWSQFKELTKIITEK